MKNLMQTVLRATSIVVVSLTFATAAGGKPTQRLTQYGHTAWRTQDGVISAENTTVQGKDGYLWISTDAGLVRFDGVRFVPSNTYANGSIGDARLLTVWRAADGTLWTGGAGFVIRLKDGRITRYAIEGRLSAFAEDDAGVTWFSMTRVNGRGGPLCRVVDEKIECFGKPDLPFVNVSTLIHGRGAFWIGDASKVCRWTPGTRAECHHLPALEAFNNLIGISALLEGSDGALWVGVSRTGPGLGLMRLERGAWKPFTRPTLDGSSLSISALIEDREGSLWIGTSDRGIFHVDGDRVDQYRGSDGLTSDMVQGFTEDREGTMWVSTSAGLDAFRRLPVSTFSVREGLPSDAVTAVLPARDGTVWISNRKLTTLRDDRVVPLPDSIPSGGLASTSLLEDHMGRIWTGLRDTLTVLDHGTSRTITTEDGAPPGVVTGIVEDAAHDVWITTTGERGGLFRIHAWVAERRLVGTPFAQPSSIAADPSNGIWLAARGGALARYDGSVLSATPADAIVGGSISAVAVDPDGTVLAASTRGLLVQRASLRRLLNVDHGLPCADFTAVLRDRPGNLWLMARCGLIEIERAEWDRWMAEPATKVRYRLLDRTDGVRPGGSSFMPKASAGTDGRLWFATDRVAQVVDPEARNVEDASIPVRIEEFIADRAAIAPAPVRPLPPKTRDIEIRYTALSLVAPQAIVFQYRLQGRDDAWQDAGSRRQAFYTDLPPGAYRFHVRASRHDGRWSEATEPLDFEIARAYYQTRWFAAACIAAGVLVLYGVYLIRLRQVAARMRDRLDVKNAERERIARDVHDTLLQSVQGLMLLFEQAARRIPRETPERALIETALDRADETVVESRDRIKELRRGAEPPADLVAAIRDTAERFIGTRGLPSALHVDVSGVPRVVCPTVAHEAVLVVREALQNAATHAEARNVVTRIAFDESELRIAVVDDGVGITDEMLQDGRPGHWGLTGMRERARRIGGRLDVHRSTVGGTSVELVVPASSAYRTGGDPRLRRGWLRWWPRSSADRGDGDPAAQ